METKILKAHQPSIQAFQIFFGEVQKEITRNSRKPFIKNFHESYIDGKVPLYALA